MDKHIEITPNPDAAYIKQPRYEDWAAADFNFHVPFRIVLSDGLCLVVDKILRIIPKRRMVGWCLWQDKPAIVKFFYHEQHAKRHMQKEMEGLVALQKCDIPTPMLYYHGMSESRRIYVLIFERLLDAISIEEIWRNRHRHDSYAILRSLIIELATQHVFGIQQGDLHLKNFLLTNEKIWTIDGGKIISHPTLLPKKASLTSLAILLAQLGVGTEIEKLQLQLFYDYATSRGWVIKKEDKIYLFFLIQQWNHQRWKLFSKKLARNSTHFATWKSHNIRGMYDRHYASPAFLDFLAHPDSAFQAENAIVLKAGRSSTVIKITFDNHDFVIKRYNLKDPWHWLRRCFRNTRAKMAWLFAQKLQLFYIPTAKPIAYIEHVFCGLKGTSYYVTDYIAGEHVGNYFLKHQQDEIKKQKMVSHLAELLNALASIQLTHGDLKMTNILIDAYECPVLIDLDGTTEHFSLSSLSYALPQEKQRLLKNFNDQADIQAYLEKEWQHK